MKINARCGIRNTFTIHVDNVETGEHREYKAHNIILNSMWDRLTAFNPYFVNIHYGQGDAEFNNPARTTLNSFLGTKAAVHVSRSAAYPTSQWRQMIVLQPAEHVGKTIKEVGIAYGSTESYLLTHAPIQDSEGNPIQLGPKLGTEIYTIYADIFVSLWSDYGAYFYANGLRNYLLGTATMATDQIAVDFMGNEESNAQNLGMMIKTSTRTRNATQKWVQGKVRFEAADYNKDVRFLRWVNMGMQIELPRPGVWEGIEKEGVILGAGDGSNKTFAVPNSGISDLVVYVNDVEQTEGTDYTFNGLSVEFGTAPESALSVTADYFCPYIPKDSDHVLDVTFRLYFDMDEPQAITPPDYSVLPGASVPVAGTTTLGFFGEVASANLITGADLITALGITQGTNIADAGWLKFARNGRIICVAKKAIRHSISWDTINAAGAVYGNRVITIGSVRYAVRLLSSAEWDALIVKVHQDVGPWWNYTNADLEVGGSYNGRASWMSTPDGSLRVIRGRDSVTYSGVGTPSSTDAFYGFRPVLEPLLPWSAD